jgi:hypothetical protein
MFLLTDREQVEIVVRKGYREKRGSLKDNGIGTGEKNGAQEYVHSAMDFVQASIM